MIHLIYIHGLGEPTAEWPIDRFAALAPWLPEVPTSQVHGVRWDDIFPPLFADEPIHRKLSNEYCLGLPQWTPVEVARGFAEFIRYFCQPTRRQETWERVSDMIWPLVTLGHKVSILAHSWGSVVGYEYLRVFGDRLPSPGVTFFSIGCPLHFRFVRERTVQAEACREKLQGTRKWVNLNAVADVVGGQLTPTFSPSAEFLQLKTPCRKPNPECAHASYFDARNKVCQEIFQRFARGTEECITP